MQLFNKMRPTSIVVSLIVFLAHLPVSDQKSDETEYNRAGFHRCLCFCGFSPTHSRHGLSD